MPDTQKELRQEVRTQRVPVSGRRTKLQLSDADAAHFKGYHLYWFNDEDGKAQSLR